MSDSLLQSRSVHQWIQNYLTDVYRFHHDSIKQTLHIGGNELYGEIYYESLQKLIELLDITPNDHFLDIGSGVGKVASYVFLSTSLSSVVGVEINLKRQAISEAILHGIKQEFPLLFTHKKFTLLNADFLTTDFSHITIAYVCSTIFSFDLLQKMGKKLNEMQTVRKIASFRKLPGLSNFYVKKRVFLQCSWDRVACYLYERKV